MLIHPSCCGLLIKFCLIGILPSYSLGFGESVLHPQIGEHETLHLHYDLSHPQLHNGRHETHHSGHSNYRTNHRTVLWPQYTPSKSVPWLQYAPNNQQSGRAPIFLHNERTSISNEGNMRTLNPHRSISSSVNSIRNPWRNFPGNINHQGTLPTPSSEYKDLENRLRKKKDGRRGRRRKNRSKQNRSQKKKEIKIKPNKYFSLQNFGMNLHAAVSNMSDKSFVMSPFSAWAALILAYYGSNGTTMEQFEHAFGIQNKTRSYIRATALEKFLQVQQSSAIFRSSNKAYIANDLVLDKRVAQMLTNVQSLNFTDGLKAASVINSDVSNVTEGKITDLVNPESLCSATRIMLVNVVYFKGKWVNKFNKKYTKKRNFYDRFGNPISTVDMMQTTANFRVGNLDSGQLLEMEYTGSTLVMHILLPNKNIDLKTLVQSVDQKAFISALEKSHITEYDVMIPKFKLETRLEKNLRKAIRSLGITEMFASGDFSAFTGAREPLAAEIVQQAVIEVDEEGTEAAAATRIGIVFMSYTPPKKFFADRPFAFYITEKKSQVTVFSGLYMGPGAMENTL